ncbi:hypothetical protein NDU88_002397 [Pleurodeles waltl]|uniref:Uncharacterized protein n=1 Tax=Pleurodeles waltl TaxID=8319 RepID=A0AAV7U9L7_PLEWA|nr:hypothetical protein NDU88_002397 [Pleurodeles waltl]
MDHTPALRNRNQAPTSLIKGEENKNNKNSSTASGRRTLPDNELRPWCPGDTLRGLGAGKLQPLGYRDGRDDAGRRAPCLAPGAHKGLALHWYWRFSAT